MPATPGDTRSNLCRSIRLKVLGATGDTWVSLIGICWSEY